MLRRQTFKIHPCPGSIAADIEFMSDDDKGGPKEPNYPDPEEIKKTLEGMFGQLGKGAFTFTGAEAPSLLMRRKAKRKILRIQMLTIFSNLISCHAISRRILTVL